MTSTIRLPIRPQAYANVFNVILGYENINAAVEGGFAMAATYPFTTGFIISNGNMTLEYSNKSNKGLIQYPADISGEKKQYDDFDPYERELRCFIGCLRNDTAPAIGSGMEAIRALRIAECIERSASNCEKILVTGLEG